MAPKAKTKQATSSITIGMSNPDEKKHVVKFVAVADDAPVSNLYLDKKVWAEMGSPTDIEVTVEVT